MFSTQAWYKTRREINLPYRCYPLILDIDRGDLSWDNSLASSSLSVRTIFKLFLFTYNMFARRGFSARIFLIQKTTFISADTADYGLGYYLLALYDEETFHKYFPLIGRAFIALNNEIMGAESLFGKDIEELSDTMAKFDAVKVGSRGTKRKKTTELVLLARNTSGLDHLIELYHLKRIFIGERWTQTMGVEEEDDDESWLTRASFLTPSYLFKYSQRMKMRYKTLLELGNCLVGGNTFTTRNTVTLNNLFFLEDNIDDSLAWSKFYKNSVRFYAWEDILKVRENETILDLSREIAWEVEIYHLTDEDHFFHHPLYQLPSGENVCRAIRNFATEFDDEGQVDSLSSDPLFVRMVEEGVERDYARSENQKKTALYPGLLLTTKIFKAMGKKSVSLSYQNKCVGRFMSTILTSTLRSIKDGSMARQLQYTSVERIQNDIFPMGYLLRVPETQEESHPFFFGRISSNVEPFHDILATYFVQMATLSGVKQMSVELVLLLLSNIVSFSPRDEKPLNVLNGPSGCGKSHVAKVAQEIARGHELYSNEYACRSEHYSTTRAHTAPTLMSHENVLGQKLVEEWQGGEVYMSDVSIESVSMKNLFDSGLFINKRCRPIKNQNGPQDLVSVTDVSLDDRSTTILANGFRACSSILNRCTFVNVPDLIVKVKMFDIDVLRKRLKMFYVSEIFSLIRYHISEYENREYSHLSLKAFDEDPCMSWREETLTFSRLEDVLEEMGFPKLTMRKKKQIQHFARTLSIMRAVFEVYASHKKCEGEGETIQLKTSQIKEEIKRLERMSDYERELAIAERVVLDPSDILTATTLVVQFSKNEEKILGSICSHFLDPFDRERNVDRHHFDEDYLVLANINMNMLSEELTRHKSRVLEETLHEVLMTLEERHLGSKRLPLLIKKMEPLNRMKEKKYQLFGLYINARQAAQVFFEENPSLMAELVDIVTNELIKRTRGSYHNNWDKVTHLGANSGFLCLEIPNSLRKSVGFLYHLDNKLVESLYFTDQKDHFSCFISPDFCFARERALQKILLEEISKNLGTFDEKGYFPLRLTRASIFQRQSQMVWERKEGPIISQDKSTILLDIFGYDGEPSLRLWRQLITDLFLNQKKLGQEGSFNLEKKDNLPDLPNSSVVSRETEVKPNLYYRSETEKNLVYVHYGLLNEIPLDINERKSVARQVIEKCLCRNMTEFKTVLFFDRETVYRTQNPLDCISFVDVKEVEKSYPDGQLPLFLTKDPFSTGYITKTAYSREIFNINRSHFGEGKISFARNHYRQKLKMNKLFSSGKISALLSDEEMSHPSFRQKLREMLRKEREEEYIFFHATEKLSEFPGSLVNYMNQRFDEEEKMDEGG